MMELSQLSCPACGASLDIPDWENSSTCVCGQAYSISNGIVDFIPENTFYWGEIQQELMKTINEHAEQVGWLEALTTNLSGRYEQIVDYTLDPMRYASIFHFYAGSQSDTCLDLGSGWGPISFGLAKFYKQVYSVDGVYERLRFQAIRARQSGIKNIKFLRSTMLRLPIPDNSVDVVIVNGLLEWIGLSEAQTSPAELQDKFLTEVRRVLKPQGRLMIGIENRFGIQYFRGRKDHTGLPYTSIMPRKLANFVVKKFKRMDDAFVYSGAEDNYRTLTHSYWGYETLLEKAGFQKPQIYWTWPSYSHPHAAGTPDGSSIRYYLQNLVEPSNHAISKLAIDLARWLPDSLMGTLIKLFSPHFLIVASNQEASAMLQDELVGPENKSFIRSTQAASLDYKTTYHCLRDGKLTKVVSVLAHSTSPGRSQLSPQSSLDMRGRMINPHNLQDVRMAAQWLAHFHTSSLQGVWQLAGLTAEIDRLCAEILHITPDDQELKELLAAYRNNFINHITGASIPQVSEHGDFTPANILVDEAGNIQVIDWGNTVTNGQPLMDIGSFYFSLLRSQAGSDFSEPISQEIDRFLSTYQQHANLGPPVQLAPAYYLLRMIERGLVDQHIHPDNYLHIKGWLKFLTPALKLVNFAQTTEAEQPNEMYQSLVAVAESKDLSSPSLQE